MKIFLIFWLAGIAGAILIQPYKYSLFSNFKPNLSSENKLPSIKFMKIIDIIQSGILLGIASFAGTRLAPKVGLNWPFLDSLLFGGKTPFPFTSFLAGSIVTGALVGLSIVIIEWFLFIDKLRPKFKTKNPNRFHTFLAAFYGGISEEIITRLFLMSLIAFIIKNIGFSLETSYLIGIWLAAFLFGLLHLPAALQLFPKTNFVVMRTIVLNMVGGVTFGWLFVVYGIESAMIAHFTADIVLHVIMGPTLNKKLYREV
ncbi:MAG: CPBP family intramembrane glutamic endopeptidase [Bacillota bacterium]